MLSLLNSPKQASTKYASFADSFIFADFTKEVVVESVGEENVGFAVATYGLASTFASLGAGKISDAVGRGPVTVVLLVGGAVAVGVEFCPVDPKSSEVLSEDRHARLHERVVRAAVEGDPRLRCYKSL